MSSKATTIAKSRAGECRSNGWHQRVSMTECSRHRVTSWVLGWPRSIYSLVQWNWFSGVTDACSSGASGDHREPISLHQAVVKQSEVWKLYFWRSCQTILYSRLCTPTHTRNRIGLGALVWQPQPSFPISDRRCLMAKKSRTECEKNSRTEDEGRMPVAWRKREREQKRGHRMTKRGQTRKTIRCYQSE